MYRRAWRLPQELRSLIMHFIGDPSLLPNTTLDSIPYTFDLTAMVHHREILEAVQQFQMLLARRGAEYVRPCISVCGGITAA